MTRETQKHNVLQAKAASPETSVWVQASAGTGKTKVLVDRILSLLIHGSQGPNILCLTFTRAAAVEMEERLLERLFSWSTMSEKALQKELQSLAPEATDPNQLRAAQQLYDRVINTEFEPKFHTIHSFCEALLRKFPQEAGIESNFTILDEQGAKVLLQTARDMVLQQLQLSKDKELQRDISYVSQYSNSDHFSTLLDLLIADRWRLEKFIMANDSNSMLGALSEKLDLPDYTCPDLLTETACVDSSIDINGLRSSLTSLQAGSKTDQRRAQTINEWLSASQHARKALFPQYCTAFLTRDQFPIKRLASAGVLAKHPDILLALQNEQSRVLEFSSKIKRAQITQCTGALLNLTKRILQQFAREKTKQNYLDYDDLIIKAGIILTTLDTSPWVLYKIDKEIDHLLIDEAQDTSLEQWEIIQALSSEFFVGEGTKQYPKTIFAVGDYKQSIYSFQRASPDSFNTMREYFRQRAKNGSASWADIGLQVSFRSAPPILEAVDLVCQQVFPKPDMAPTENALPLQHLCWRDQAPGLVELWPILKPNKCPREVIRPLPTEVSGQKLSRTTLAQLVAQKINALLLNTCAYSTSCRPEDIMVLVRRRGPFVLDLIKELKTLSIPVTGIDRITLADSIAVMDLISLGHFMLNTNDDLSLAEVLKSPLCNLDDKNLFDLAHNRAGSLWGSLQNLAATSSQFQEVRSLLESLLEKAGHFSPSELYADLLITRNYKKYFVSRIGVECIDPINEFLNQAIEYEARKSPSLEGFIYWLENNYTTAKREPTQNGAQAVRILTVHGAKGLESPIVFLPDTVQKSRNNNPLIWPHSDTFPIWIPNATLLDPLTSNWVLERKKREAEEYQRLLYVAMTRAKDQLYICGWSETPNVPEDCWHNIVSQAFKKVRHKTSEGASFTQEKNVPSGVLRLANFKPMNSGPSHPRPLFTKASPLPPWVNSTLKSCPPKSSHRGRPIFNTPPFSPVAKRSAEGLTAHLVNSLYLIAESERETAADKFIFHLSQKRSANVLHAVKNWSLKILKSPDLSFLFLNNSQGCLTVSGPVKHGRQTSLFSRSIDRLVDSGDSVLLINFLARNNYDTSIPHPPADFLQDIAIKASLAKFVFPKKDLTSAILWTDEQRLQNISQDMLKKRLS